MTEDVVSIKSDMSAISAIERLLKRKISGMPVVDDEMHLDGIVSKKIF